MSMKRNIRIVIVAFLLAIGFLFAACVGNQKCPAYTNKEIPQNKK